MTPEMRNIYAALMDAHHAARAARASVSRALDQVLASPIQPAAPAKREISDDMLLKALDTYHGMNQPRVFSYSDVSIRRMRDTLEAVL